MTEAQQKQNYKKPMKFFGINRISPVLAKYKSMIILITILSLLATVFDILIPQFQKYAINVFIGGETLDGFKVFVSVYVIFLIIQVLFNLVSVLVASHVELSITRDLRRMSFDHLQELSFSYYNKNSVGYLHSRVMSDTSNIGEVVVWSLMEGVWHISYVVGVIVIMLIMNWRLALVSLSILPVMVIGIIFFEKKLVAVNRKIRELNSVITGDFNEGITGAKTIKTLAIEDKMIKEFNEDTKKMRIYAIKSKKLRGVFFSIVSFSSTFALALVLWQGGLSSINGIIEIGTLSVFMTYAMNLAEPIQWTVEVFSNLISTKVNIERVTNLLAETADVADSPEVVEKYGDSFNPKTENWEDLRGDIEFKDVTFRYPDGDENVLEHFNLKVPFGTNVAIVGETGAGKSTLVNLVCRFFEPTEGAILVDGRDLRQRSQLWMHRSIGYVLQTPHLFSGTIADNLRYGNPDATDEEINEAIRLVGADELIKNSENGLNSQVGEGGDLLSVGEKQLLSFARAILAKPKILILDEATSSIDTITEQKLQKATASVLKGRTSFVIAHRLSTIRDADIILVVRNGKIVEKGTHATLMTQKGYYYELQCNQYREEALKEIFE